MLRGWWKAETTLAYGKGDEMRFKVGLENKTAVVTGVNGIPWWYFYQLEGPYENHRLESVDPGGRIWDAVGPERAIGCVVYPAAEIAEPEPELSPAES